MPLHNVLFRNSKGHTYYSPKLVQKGVTKVTKLAEVMEGGGGGLKAPVSLPPTWRTIYPSAIPFVSSLPIQDLPIAWNKHGPKMSTAMQPLEEPQKRPEPEVWEQLAKLKMPGVQRDFMRKAPWKKLIVGARTQKAYYQPNCDLCAKTETIKHVLSGCKFWSVACDIITKTFGPVWDGEVMEKLSAPRIEYQSTRMMREARDMHNNGCQSVLRDRHYDGIWYRRVGKWLHYMEKTY